MKEKHHRTVKGHGGSPKKSSEIPQNMLKEAMRESCGKLKESWDLKGS